MPVKEVAGVSRPLTGAEKSELKRILKKIAVFVSASMRATQDHA